MLYYVAHCYGGKEENLDRARRIVHDLQTADLENAYICPLLAFSALGYKELGYEEEMALCLDLLSVCDVLLVASELSEGVKREIDFAKLIGMEVRQIEDRCI